MGMRKTGSRRSLMQMTGAIMALAVLAACAHPAIVEDTGAHQMDLARAAHQNSVVLDGHADIVLPSTSLSYQGPDGRSKVAPDKLAAGGVGAVVMSIAVGPGPRTPQGDAAGRAEADEKLAAIRALDAEHDQIVIATTPDEVLAVRAQGRTALILGFQNARSLEGDPAALDAFYAAGVRVFGLNHMGHNDFSDSSRPLYDGETKSYEAGAEHGGLSTLGVQAIARINALGGIVDVSQMSKDATLQAIALSTTPVIASHSNVRALSDVSRNLSDEEIDRIGETGGVIHVAAFGAYLVDLSDADLLAQIRAVRREAGLPEPYSYPYELYWELHDPAAQTAFLTAMRDVIGRGSVDRMIDHVDYIVARIGIDHVGIGTDFNHGGGVEGFNEADEAFNVTLSLIERGYAPDDIEKIWGGNFLRVFQAVLPASARRRSASCWRLSSWSPRSMR